MTLFVAATASKVKTINTLLFSFTVKKVLSIAYRQENDIVKHSTRCRFWSSFKRLSSLRSFKMRSSIHVDLSQSQLIYRLSYQV